MPFLYILKSIKHKKTYVGSTTNLERRLMEYNIGYCSFTKKYKPWKILYKEEFNNLLNAREREKFFKSTSGRKLIKKLYSGVAQW